MATYVIGDTHGCLFTLKYLLEEKIGIKKSDSIYFLGDYIDRGIHSAQLVDYIISLIDGGYNIHPVRGNHEQMLLDSFTSKSAYRDWMLNTGKLTLNSYIEFLGKSFRFPKDIPESHLRFFNQLPYYIKINKYILVHGALNFNAEDPFSDTLSMLWSRAEALPDDFLPKKVVIHGHTPVPLEEIKETVSSVNARLISLDGGCVYKGRFPGIGYLVALELNSKELFWVEKLPDDMNG